MKKIIPRISTRGYYDLTYGKTLKKNSYFLYPKKDFEKLIGKEFQRFKTQMLTAYHPELYHSPTYNENEVPLYRSIIGSCNWAITLGRFNISCNIYCE